MPPNTACPKPPTTAKAPPAMASRGDLFRAIMAMATAATMKGSCASTKASNETTPEAPAASMAARRSAGSALNSGCARTEMADSRAVTTKQVAANRRAGVAVIGSSMGWVVISTLGTRPVVRHRPAGVLGVLSSRWFCRLQVDPVAVLAPYSGDVNRVATPRVGDIALAAVVAAVAMVEIWIPLPSVLGDGSRVLSSAVALLACAALTQRRRTAGRRARGPGRLAARVHRSPRCWCCSGASSCRSWWRCTPSPATATVAGVLGAVAGAGTLLYFDLRVPELGDPSEIVFHWMVSAVAFGLGFFVHSFERRRSRGRARRTR